MSEQGKSVEEVAKAVSQVAELAGKVGGFFAKIVGEPVEQLSGIATDWGRYYRYKNLATIFDRVTELRKLRQSVGKTTPIPLRVALPIIEAASLENEETLQDIWARLIANAMESKHPEAMHPGFTEVIKQLSVDEVLILDGLAKNYFQRQRLIEQSNGQALEPDEAALIFFHRMEMDSISLLASKGMDLVLGQCQQFCRDLKLKQPEKIAAHIDNLRRLRIVEIGFDLIPEEPEWIQGVMQLNSVSVPRLVKFYYFRISSFGQQLIAACAG